MDFEEEEEIAEDPNENNSSENNQEKGFSDDDMSYASRIVDLLMEAVPMERFLEPNLAIGDLVLDVNSFNSDYKFAEEYDVNLPALEIFGRLVPISIEYLFNTPYYPGNNEHLWWQQLPFMYELGYSIAKQLKYLEQTKEFRTMNRDEARGSFIEGAYTFLATRVAAVRAFQGLRNFWNNIPKLTFPGKNENENPIITPGCLFSVTTNSIGLRVFRSGAYRISAKYFGQPTSPTTGTLQSGTYIFGVDGGAYGNAVQWDTNAVVTLPGEPSVHLNY
jgi:hypothetical protein